MSTNVLEFCNVAYNAGSTSLLSRASLTLMQNSIHAIIGPNGAGKSTLLKLALGLLQPSSGRIKVLGKIAERQSFKYIGALIESVSLYYHLSVYDNLLIAALQHNLNKPDIYEALEIVKLTDQKLKKAKDLSMGMKQRLGIATAIIHKPQILLLDEPTNGLDPEGVIALRELLLYLKNSQNVAILLTSHVLEEINKLADDISLIKDGSITFTGSAKEFNISHNIEQEYLSRVK